MMPTVLCTCRTSRQGYIPGRAATRPVIKMLNVRLCLTDTIVLAVLYFLLMHERVLKGICTVLLLASIISALVVFFIIAMKMFL